MGCSCEELLKKEGLRIGDIGRKLKYLAESDYKNGGVCGEFEVQHWYECETCNSIYIGQVYDGSLFPLQKYFGGLSSKELLESLKDKES